VLLLIGFIWFSIRTVKYRQQLRLQELRNKIASDLHDDIGGTLANISLLMSVAETKQDPLTVSGIHKRVQEDAKNTILNMRGMLMAIHPGNDQAIDFFEKIRSSFSEALQMHHLESHFDFQLPDALKLTLDQQHHIFLLFKEIINNTLKHAEAHHLNSFVRLKNYWLMIQVTDDGRGFDPLVEHNGNGIRNIRSRVKAIHGTVEIVSGPGGTQYQIAIPMT
jgi:signal transduction histidine kinase